MSTLTNVHNLPQPLVSAISNDQYVKVGDISVTALAKSPRQRWLEIRHADEITEDASERIWALLGSIGHKILERANTDNHLAEERLTASVLGWKVSGQADLLGPDATLYDYKFTSVWAVKDAKPEWEAQLNAYAWLYSKHNFEVKALRIVAILRDWSKRKAKREPDYPQVGVVVREVPLWRKDQQESYIYERVQAHQNAQVFDDNNLPFCTAEERWARPDLWVVKKRDAKRALRLFDTEENATKFIAADSDPKWSAAMIIEHRPGESIKCEDYCPVSQWCNQFAKSKEGVA